MKKSYFFFVTGFFLFILQNLAIVIRLELSMIKGQLNPKIDFSSFEHLGIVVSRAVQKNLMFCNESTRFDRRLNMRCQRLFMK